MSNFEEKFNNWKERMKVKTEKERDNYALSVAFFLTAIVVFFVVSNWYFIISGNSINSSLFTDLEQMFYEQKRSFSKYLLDLNLEKQELMDQLNATSTQ